jgi:hypothetical protein
MECHTEGYGGVSRPSGVRFEVCDTGSSDGQLDAITNKKPIAHEHGYGQE